METKIFIGLEKLNGKKLLKWIVIIAFDTSYGKLCSYLINVLEKKIPSSDWKPISIEVSV